MSDWLEYPRSGLKSNFMAHYEALAQGRELGFPSTHSFTLTKSPDPVLGPGPSPVNVLFARKLIFAFMHIVSLPAIFVMPSDQNLALGMWFQTQCSGLCFCLGKQILWDPQLVERRPTEPLENSCSLFLSCQTHAFSRLCSKSNSWIWAYSKQSSSPKDLLIQSACFWSCADSSAWDDSISLLQRTSLQVPFLSTCLTTLAKRMKMDRLLR